MGPVVLLIHVEAPQVQEPVWGKDTPVSCGKLYVEGSKFPLPVSKTLLQIRCPLPTIQQATSWVEEEEHAERGSVAPVEGVVGVVVGEGG